MIAIYKLLDMNLIKIRLILILVW